MLPIVVEMSCKTKSMQNDEMLNFKVELIF
jgi:hypothetical protein